ncbi:MAG: hypothetical protein ACFFG0_37355 [Candidatus Thorarchaeota archaeon]
MRTPKIRPKHGPEYEIQQKIKKYLEDRGWFVVIITASLYLKGMPDLYATHRIYRGKWIEVKQGEKWKFTKEQKEKFPELLGKGTPIWIMFGADKQNYDLLFEPCNAPYWLALKG